VARKRLMRPAVAIVMMYRATLMPQVTPPNLRDRSTGSKLIGGKIRGGTFATNLRGNPRLRLD
jgi:hypothetical protein